MVSPGALPYGKDAISLSNNQLSVYDPKETGSHFKKSFYKFSTPIAQTLQDADSLNRVKLSFKLTLIL